jgi:hypothetical protein
VTVTVTVAGQVKADRRRFPAGPLLEMIDARGVSQNRLHRQAGIHYGRVVRAGTLNGDQADRAAVLLGLHPCEIWGDLWWQP